MNSAEEEKTAKSMLSVLRSRSQKGLKLAKKAILAERIEGKSTREALETYFSNWTNFIHPGLFSLACEASGGNPDAAVSVQAAISMLAAAFDLHDDIIDNSVTKQGRPTVLGRFGRGTAVLLGDAFLVRGFTLLSESLEDRSQDKRKRTLRVLRESLFKLGNAHSLELSLKRRTDIAPEEYKPILEMKAASLEADMRVGAIIGGGRNREVESLAEFGRMVGILVTLREEFVDVFDFKELKQRMKWEYLPIPVQYVFQNKVEKEAILNILSSKRAKKEEAEKVVGMILRSDGIRELKDYMRTLVNEAISQLREVRESEAKLLLTKLAIATLEDI